MKKTFKSFEDVAINKELTKEIKDGRLDVTSEIPFTWDLDFGDGNP